MLISTENMLALKCVITICNCKNMVLILRGISAPLKMEASSVLKEKFNLDDCQYLVKFQNDAKLKLYC